MTRPIRKSDSAGEKISYPQRDRFMAGGGLPGSTGDRLEERNKRPDFIPGFKRVKKQPRSKEKRKQEGAEENVERWLVSYADFITLLFAFFVSLYSISRVDHQRLNLAAHSMQRALGSLSTARAMASAPGPSSSAIPPGPSPHTPSEDPEKMPFQRMAEEIKKEVGKVSASGNQIQYIIHEGELIVRVPEGLFFDSGQASIRPEVIPLLGALGGPLSKIPNPISVEGHTDNVPIHTPLFQSNWELSSARATAIIRHLLTQYDFDPDRLSAAGYAEFRPVSPNTSAAGRLKNRRVDLVILAVKKG